MWLLYIYLNVSQENISCTCPQAIEVFTYSHFHHQYTSPLHLIYIVLKISQRPVANPSPESWCFVQKSLLYPNYYISDNFSICSKPENSYPLTFLSITLLMCYRRQPGMHFLIFSSLTPWMLYSYWITLILLHTSASI